MAPIREVPGKPVVVLVGECDPDVADVAAGLADLSDGVGGTVQQRVGVLEAAEDAVLVIHHQQGGPVGIDGGELVAHAVPFRLVCDG